MDLAVEAVRKFKVFSGLAPAFQQVPFPVHQQGHRPVIVGDAPHRLQLGGVHARAVRVRRVGGRARGQPRRAARSGLQGILALGVLAPEQPGRLVEGVEQVVEPPDRFRRSQEQGPPVPAQREME